MGGDDGSFFNGLLAYDRQDYTAALAYFDVLQQRADALQNIDFQIDALTGRAKTLLRLGQAEEALIAASASLLLAQEQGDTLRQVSALRVKSDVYLHHDLPLPEQMASPSPALHFNAPKLAHLHFHSAGLQAM